MRNCDSRLVVFLYTFDQGCLFAGYCPKGKRRRNSLDWGRHGDEKTM